MGPGPNASHETEYECSSLSARPRFSSMSPHARGFPRGHACRGRGHLRRIVGVAPVVWGNSTRLHMASIENMYMVTRNRRARCFFLGHAHVPGARPCSPAALGREADQRGSSGRLSCPHGQMSETQAVARMTPHDRMTPTHDSPPHDLPACPPLHHPGCSPDPPMLPQTPPLSPTCPPPAAG